MDCAEEVALLRGALSKLDGLGSLSFNVVQARMTVEYDAERLDAAKIAHAVQTTGMRCEEWTEESTDDAGQERRGWSQASILTLISGLSLGIGMIWEAAHSENVLASLLVHDHSLHHAPGGALLFFLIAIIAGATPALPKARRSAATSCLSRQ